MTRAGSGALGRPTAAALAASLLVLAACGASGARLARNPTAPANGHPTAAGTVVSAPAATSVVAAPPTFVDVSVATLWVRPGGTRTIDRPSLTNPAYPKVWARSLSVSQRQWLVGRLETQVLLGRQVLVLGTRNGWSHVLVPGQPTPRDRRGYPGWVPTRQLRSSAAFAALGGDPFAEVVRPTAWLRSRRDGRRLVELGYGTRLPVSQRRSDAVVVALPSGLHVLLRTSDIRVYAHAASIPVPTGAQLVADARRFLGLRYLWAGRSAFGFDCSGFTSLLYEARGVTIPRDADAQARAGHAVSRKSLRAGDLVFFGKPVHHVALYIGGGQVIESPNSSSAVRIRPLASRSDYVGARRYLP